VTWLTSDIVQKVLKSSFQTGCISSPNYFHIFFLITFLKQAFVRNNIIFTMHELYNYCIIIISIKNNNVLINNNFESFQDLILLFKIPMGTRKDFLEICKQLAQAS